MKTILLEASLHPDGIAILKEAGHNLIGPFPADSPERRAALASAHAIIIGSVWQVDDDMLKGAPLLEVVGRPGIGLDNVDLDACTRAGVCVVHTPDAPTQSTAEHAFALLMALAKHTVTVDREFRSKGWNAKSTYPPRTELKGKTLGLVGLGRIGGTISKMAQGFDMRVIVYDPFIADERARQIGVERKGSLYEVLAEADFVSLHSALTPLTRGMIGAKELQAMKRTAVLINCSRGPVVNEADLIEALRNGTIAGAGLDVFEVEPTPSDNPLLAMENVVLSPHIASGTGDGILQMGVGTAEEVNAVLGGMRPRWLPNAEVWEKRRSAV